MSKNRIKTNLIHKKDGNIFELSKEKISGKLFIKNTNIEVAANKVTRKGANSKGVYDFNKPYQAQDLGDEWDDYAWSGNDF